jgi:hypothetical protein
MAKFRHEIYKVVKGTDPRGDKELQERQKAEFDRIKKAKPQYMQDALNLYDFKLVDGDSRDCTLVMDEIYIDF